MRRARAELRAGLIVAALAVAAPAQDAPRFALDVAIAPAAQRSDTPALAWLCDAWLPQHPAWPRGLDPSAGVRVAWTDAGVTIAPLATAMPPATAALGVCVGDGGGAAWFACGADGAEDWYVPNDFALPTPWRRLLARLDALALDRPRTLDIGVVVGHLAGALADADRRAELLQLGASQCGEATWLAWRTPEWLRVRGRSGGGLCVPAVLMALAANDGPRVDGLALRAFAARDADRAEAARQMLRRQQDAGVRPTLRAALFADDETRLAAIDTLVRRGATADLAAIVAAAADGSPWATLAAADALRSLWPHARPADRQRAREALARSDNATLRALDLDAALPGPTDVDVAPAPGPLRAMAALALLGLALVACWARERARLAADAG
jgi:hypothetical protein